MAKTFDAGDGPKNLRHLSSPLTPPTASDGLPSTFNDHGDLLFNLVFYSGAANETNALVRATVPFPGDANGDNLVNTDDFRAFYNHYDQPGAQTQGDFNHDGRVDFADFQLLERWFGQSATAAPVPISATDAAMLDAFAQSVPEPATLALLLIPLLLRRRRMRSDLVN